MKKRMLTCACFWLAGAMSQQADAQNITRLIDSQTSYGAFGHFSNMSDPVFDGSSMVFSGNYSNGTAGIFRVSATTGQVQMVASVGSVMPNSSTLFAQLGMPFVNNGMIAFTGASSSASQLSGVYEQASPSSPLTRVVDTKTLLPGTGTAALAYDIYERPAIDNGVIAFVAGYSGFSGVYTSDSSGLHLIANQSTIIPGDTKPFIFMTDPTISGGAVTFVGTRGTASTVGEMGIYTSRNGTLQTVVNDTTVMPGGVVFNLEGTSDRYINASGSTLQFNGDTANGILSVYLDNAGTFTRAFKFGDPMPGDPATTIDGGGYQALDGNLSVYNLLGLDDTMGLYVQNGSGPLTPFIVGNSFDGRTLSYLDLVGGSLSHSQVVFEAVFRDGSSGIYLATIPEPGCMAVISVLLTALCHRSRRSTDCAKHGHSTVR